MKTFKHHNQAQGGFSLLEVALALVIAGIVGAAAMGALIKDAEKLSAYAQGTALNDVRKAMQAYVAAYRSEIAADSVIVANGTQITSKTGTATDCRVSDASGTTRCPSIATLTTLKLLPAGFKATGLQGGQSYWICGIDASANQTETSSNNSECGPLTQSCAGNSCDISGIVAYALPLKKSGDTLTSNGFDLTTIGYVIEKLENRGAFSKKYNTNMRRQGDGDIWIRNPHSNRPAGMVAGVFSTTLGTVSLQANVDYCPSKDIYIDTKNSPATVRVSNASGALLTKGTDYLDLVSSTSCQGSFLTSDTLATGMSSAAGYKTSGNTTGALSVGCVPDSAGSTSTSRRVLPTYRVISC